jgi:hypothetical protein
MRKARTVGGVGQRRSRTQAGEGRCSPEAAGRAKPATHPTEKGFSGRTGPGRGGASRDCRVDGAAGIGEKGVSLASAGVFLGRIALPAVRNAGGFGVYDASLC